MTPWVIALIAALTVAVDPAAAQQAIGIGVRTLKAIRRRLTRDETR